VFPQVGGVWSVLHASLAGLEISLTCGQPSEKPTDRGRWAFGGTLMVL
jgi:hypothetical protein